MSTVQSLKMINSVRSLGRLMINVLIFADVAVFLHSITKVHVGAMPCQAAQRRRLCIITNPDQQLLLRVLLYFPPLPVDILSK